MCAASLEATANSLLWRASRSAAAYAWNTAYKFVQTFFHDTAGLLSKFTGDFWWEYATGRLSHKMHFGGYNLCFWCTTYRV